MLPDLWSIRFAMVHQVNLLKGFDATFFLSSCVIPCPQISDKFCLLSILSQQGTHNILLSSTPIRGVLASTFNDLNKSLGDDRIGLPGGMKTIEPEE